MLTPTPTPTPTPRPLRTSTPAPRAGCGPEQGFSLIELIIALGLVGIVFSVLSGVMLGALQANLETKVRLDETRDEQFAAAYFAGDVAGATAMASKKVARCGVGTAVAELSGASFDTSSPPRPTVTVVSYVFTTPTVDGVRTGMLTRNVCERAGGSSSSYPWTPATKTVVARTLSATSPTIACAVGDAVVPCSATSTAMRLTLARRSGADPFVLAGTRRTTS